MYFHQLFCERLKTFSFHRNRWVFRWRILRHAPKEVRPTSEDHFLSGRQEVLGVVQEVGDPGSWNGVYTDWVVASWTTTGWLCAGLIVDFISTYQWISLILNMLNTLVWIPSIFSTTAGRNMCLGIYSPVWEKVLENIENSGSRLHTGGSCQWKGWCDLSGQMFSSDR